MEITTEERQFMELYNNFGKNYNDLEFRKLDTRWTSDGTKETMWISIYNKLPINAYIENMLFIPKFDEQTIISEMDSYRGLPKLRHVPDVS